MDWNESVSRFFLEYVTPTRKSGFTESGNLTFTTIRAAANLLIIEGVFKSVLEMKRQAAKDYNIILPENIFE